MSVCPSVCPSVRLSVRLCARPSVRLTVRLLNSAAARDKASGVRDGSGGLRLAVGYAFAKLPSLAAQL